MTTTTRQAITISVLWVAGLAFLVGDLHKTMIGAAWPYLVAFFDYLGK